VDFKVLGPLDVVDGDRSVELGGRKQRAVLAMLALRPGQVVSTDALVDGLWGDAPPATAAKSLQVYVSRLRKTLGEGAIVTRATGYLLAASPDDVDLARFEQLTAEARREEPAAAAETLRAALDLWRGRALADVAEVPFARAESARLEEIRVAALEDRIDADIALGRSAEVVGELEGLVRLHPYRERLRGQLMLALYRSGRQADALGAYRDARTTLANELGLEPGDDLRELERRMLAHDPTLAGPRKESIAESPPATARRRRLAVVAAAILAAAVGATVGIAALTSGGEAAPVVAPANSVALIDPAQDRVVAAVPLGERPTRIAAHGDSVWVLHPDRSTVSHVSVPDRSVLGTVGVGGAPSGLVADQRGAWVSDARSGKLTLIESDRLTVADRVSTRRRPLQGPYPDAGPLAIGFGSLWFASGGSTISRIDPTTGVVTARIRPVSTGESNGGIAIGADSVWVAGPFQESPLTRIDPTRNAVLSTIPLAKFRSGGVAVVGDAVWVADPGGDKVWRIDTLRNIAVGTAQVGSAPLGVVAGHGSVWVANAGDGSVSRIDPITGRVVATVTVGGSPTGVAVTDDAVWVTVA
jgi:YVTN family beta-propeller protein